MADQDGSIMQVSVTGDREIHVQEREREGEMGEREGKRREEGGEKRGEGKQRREEEMKGGRERGRGMGKEEREEKRRERGIKGKEKKQAMKELTYIQSSYLLLLKILFTSSSFPFPPRKSKPLLPPLTPAPRPSKGVAKQNR